jgi:alpha-glucosidase
MGKKIFSRNVNGFVLLLLCAAGALGQDLRTIASPNGQVEFRVFVAPPAPGELDRLAYQVWYRGKPLLDTSFLGLEIRNQLPLGGKVGLIGAHTSSGERYRSLTAEYMQNGSLGRLINLEVRTYDNGVAFRYVIPRSTPLEQIEIENEDTEFRFTEDVRDWPSLLPSFEAKAEAPGAMKLSQIPQASLIALPFIAEHPAVGWVAIAEARTAQYPAMLLNHSAGTTLIASLPPLVTGGTVAFQGATPLTGPWRVVLFGPTRESVTNSTVLRSLQ